MFSSYESQTHIKRSAKLFFYKIYIIKSILQYSQYFTLKYIIKLYLNTETLKINKSQFNSFSLTRIRNCIFARNNIKRSARYRSTAMVVTDRPGVHCISLQTREQPKKIICVSFIDCSLSTSSHNTYFLTVAHLTSPHTTQERERMEEVEETHEMREVEQNQAAAEEELELGLSLGAKKFTTCNTTSSKSTCRILTAKDFRPVTGGPTSSASSSSSAVGSGGTKRAKPGPSSPEGAVGSSQPPR